MSEQVSGKPIAMWSDDELREFLNGIICTRGTSWELLAIAELTVRAFDRICARPEKTGRPTEGSNGTGA